MKIVHRAKSRALRLFHEPTETVFRWIEHRRLSRVMTLREIPYPSDRMGGLGSTTYAEWCFTIGLFQTLIFQNLVLRPVRILDVGCGAGRLYLAAKPYLTEQDRFIGIDVNREVIDRCKRLYSDDRAEFFVVDAENAHYAAGGSKILAPWPISDNEINLVTALSVWTHLREDQWRFYLGEVSRVLKPGGRAVISFFVKDELYKPELKTDRPGRYYPQPENKWIFDSPAYGSADWTYPSWATSPEVAIAVEGAAFKKELVDAGLEVLSFFPGQWKDQPGFFFQDVAVLSKVKV